MNPIQLLILDVDGVLTDGRVFPVFGGDDTTPFAGKAFQVQDGCAIKLWQRSGGKTAILSGRASRYVQDRAGELGISTCRMGVTDKLAGYLELLESLGHTDATTAYMGDDLPDLPPMQRCALPIAVANAIPTLKRYSTYVTARSGGAGAVAEVVELILRKQRRWTRSLLAEA